MNEAVNDATAEIEATSVVTLQSVTVTETTDSKEGSSAKTTELGKEHIASVKVPGFSKLEIVPDQPASKDSVPKESASKESASMDLEERSVDPPPPGHCFLD